MRSQEHHHKLDETGIGKCSVPMWCNGLPAGFCDKQAFGEEENGQIRYGQWIRGHWESCYIPGLACYHHGGPKSRVFQDGNAWCAVWPDFENRQESPAGFGDTPQQARAALAKAKL
jgi:hypothetical protein